MTDRAFHRIPSLTCVCALSDDRVPVTGLRALAAALPHFAAHSEIVVVANGIGAEAARELIAVSEGIPDLTVHFLADAVEHEVAVLVGMDRALGDWVVVLTPSEAEVAALPALLAATAGHEVVFAAGPSCATRDLRHRVGGLFFGLVSRLVGAPIEWPTPALRAYSRAAARWLTGRLDGEILLRSLALRGAFPGRRIEVAALADEGFVRPWGQAMGKAVRHVGRASTLPLRLAVGLALVGAAAGFAALLYTIVMFLVHPGLQPGWTTMSGLLSLMMLVFSALFALLTVYILALYSSIQPRSRVPVIREFRSPLRRLEGTMDVAGMEPPLGFGATAVALPVITPAGSGA